MSPRNSNDSRYRSAASSVTPESCRKSSSARPNRNRSSASSSRAVPVRQGAGEHLENRPPRGRSAAQRPGQHGQLVVVGKQGRARVRVIGHEWKTTEKECTAVGRGNCELCCPVLSGCE